MKKTEIVRGEGSDLAPNIDTPELIHRLDAFFELMPPLELRDHLIELYHNYIMHEHESLPYNFSQLAEGMILFLDFLKFADEECKGQHSETE